MSSNSNESDNQWLTEILELLDDNLANAPSTATEIGWEKWGEEKQEYYKQAEKLILQKISEALSKFESRIDFNANDMGEMGIFIRTVYVHNFIDDLRQKLGLLPLHQAKCTIWCGNGFHHMNCQASLNKGGDSK